MLQRPQPKEVVLRHDRAWEGNVSGYHTFLHDDDEIRVYYRGAQLNERMQDGPSRGQRRPRHEVTCLATSPDGIHWEKPNLGLISFEGTTANNIILTGDGAHNFFPFRDENPNADPKQRYKAFGTMKSPGRGLLPFTSADGIRWGRASDTPVITDGKFDSQNVAFWDQQIGAYRAYYRDTQDGVRAIKMATSPDFLEWSPGQWLEYTDAPPEQLYTNQVMPYYRAPHIYLGFPTRIVPDRGAITEGLFMSSRDGLTFHRFGEAFLPPGMNRDRWGNRSNYIWYGLIETPSDVPGGANELSLYAIEHYYEGNENRVRRFTLRMDGFVSIHAPMAGGDVLTRPITFLGERLVVNVSTSAAGSLHVGIEEVDGSPIPGYTLAECDVIWGDSIEYPVTWNQSPDVHSLQGRPVRLRFSLRDADLFSFRFI